MGTELQGKRVAFVVTDGVEQVELTEPWRAVQEAGGEPVLVSPKDGRIQGVRHFDLVDTFPVDVSIDRASAGDFDGLVLPGGVANPDVLRQDERVVSFVRTFFDDGKPVAAICHAPWTLIDAGVVRGRTVTSWPSLKADLRNAGATWIDEEAVVDRGLITSRNPGDLPAFCAKVVEEFAKGSRPEQAEAARQVS